MNIAHFLAKHQYRIGEYIIYNLKIILFEYVYTERELIYNGYFSSAAFNAIYHRKNYLLHNFRRKRIVYKKVIILLIVLEISGIAVIDVKSSIIQ